MTNVWPGQNPGKDQSARRNYSVHNLQTISPLLKNRAGNIESFDPSCSRNVYVEIARGSVCSWPLNFDSIVEVEQGNFISTEQQDSWLQRTAEVFADFISTIVTRTYVQYEQTFAARSGGYSNEDISRELSFRRKINSRKIFRQDPTFSFIDRDRRIVIRTVG